VITGPADILGTASSATLATWTLAYRLTGDSTFTTISSATTSVNAASLGAFDPTLLINGIYQLRLTVVDVSGRQASASTTTVVDGNQKVGRFSISFLDVAVPLSGFPLQITRTYDSQDKRSGDFGVGWSLGLRNVRLQENRALGEGWSGTRSFVTFCIEPVAKHVVTVTLPDNTIYQFEPVLTPRCQGLSAPDEVSLSFRSLPGTPSDVRLEPLDVRSALVSGPFPGPVDLLDFDSLAFVDPNRYRLTLANGTALEIDQSLGLQSLTDLNGNILTVASNGITHSSGTGVSFTRDARGRITRITDPSGHFLTYAYDGDGNLASATDRAGSTTTFTYDPRHNLLSVIDPLGNPGVRSEYDSSGRLVAVVDALGHRTELAHDVAARSEVITDRRGNATIVTYDERGNVSSRRGPDGAEWRSAYDSHDNLLSEVAPDGGTRTYTYDANDYRLSATDELGNVTRYSYDSTGHLLTIRDALGQTTALTYDAQGNQTSVADPLGQVEHYTYDARANLLTRSDPTGRTTSYTYDASGNATQMTDPAGGITRLTYETIVCSLPSIQAAAPSLTRTTPRTGQPASTRTGKQHCCAMTPTADW
jgi:YD repeat-containing protein